MNVRLVLLLGSLAAGAGEARGQVAMDPRIPPPDTAASLGTRRILLDAGVLGAQLAYARRVAPRAWLAAGVGGGLLVGFMATPRVITDDDVFAFIELVAATAVLQWEIGSRLEAEGGVRAAWMYHPSNEAESIFAGAQAAAFWRVGQLQLGPRLYLGRIAEENGSGRAVVGVVPLIARVVWSW